MQCFVNVFRCVAVARNLSTSTVDLAIYYGAKQHISSDRQPCFQTRGQLQKVIIRPRNNAGKVPSSIKETKDL